MRKISTHFYNFYNHVWLFLEIHMQKIIFISFVLLCIDDVSLSLFEDYCKGLSRVIKHLMKLFLLQVCAINFFFILTIAIAINFRRTAQILVINVMATAVAVLMVIKMLYQIDYIKHEDWDRNCTVSVIFNYYIYKNITNFHVL